MIHFLSEFIKLYLIGVWLLLKQLFNKHNHFHDENLDLRNRVAIVTGGAGGIGFEVSKRLTKLGAHVIIGARNERQLEEAVHKIKSQFPDAQVEGIPVDLASFTSVRNFVDTFLGKGLALHYLVNNAGVMLCPLSRTESGLEGQFGVNYVSHFLLSRLLLPTLKSSADPHQYTRIVNVSSEAHRWSHLVWDNLNAELYYSPHEAYAQSKLAVIMSSYEMNRTLAADCIAVNCVHPGVVNSDLYRHLSQPINAIFKLLGKLFFKTLSQGADTVLYATLSPHIEGRGGLYLDNCQEVNSNVASYVRENQEKLWKRTMEYINEK